MHGQESVWIGERHGKDNGCMYSTWPRLGSTWFLCYATNGRYTGFSVRAANGAQVLRFRVFRGSIL